MNSMWFNIKNNKFFKKLLAILSVFALTSTIVEAARHPVKGKSVTTRTRAKKRAVRPKTRIIRKRRAPIAKRVPGTRRRVISRQVLTKVRGRSPVRTVRKRRALKKSVRRPAARKVVARRQTRALQMQQAEALRLRQEANAREQAHRAEERARPEEVLRREREAEDELIRTNFFQVNAPAPFDEQLDQRIRNALERMTVDENPMPGTAPAPGSRVVRRSWSDYARDNAVRRIVFCSGHTGHHGGTYGTTQGPEYYMIDQCWGEVDSDAVLDMNNERQMRYLPSGVVDQIVADDQRGLRDETIEFLSRVLKPGGKMIFRSGFGLEWPQLALVGVPIANPGDLAEIGMSDSGRYANASRAKWIKVGRKPAYKDKFVAQALGKARRYYGARGYSQVDFDQGLFVLTK
ncbi:MAG: hypothetical protein BGO67_00385 [Alphaproteobacteria bacterium 41-28]|nr:MAG: hypothetical protein BGO67_00385 [Alphaproteobacteria bacterium 41-28]